MARSSMVWPTHPVSTAGGASKETTRTQMRLQADPSSPHSMASMAGAFDSDSSSDSSDSVRDKKRDLSYSPPRKRRRCQSSGRVFSSRKGPQDPTGTTSIAKKLAKDADPNGGQCIITRDLLEEAAIQTAHLIPQKVRNDKTLVSACSYTSDRPAL